MSGVFLAYLIKLLCKNRIHYKAKNKKRLGTGAREAWKNKLISER